MHRSYMLLAAVLFFSVGCQGIGRPQPIEGAADYSHNGKEINPPNQVRVDNPYGFPVKVTWKSDKEVVLAAHSSRLILFEGMNEPGSIRIYKLDGNGKQTDAELTYVVKPARTFSSAKAYEIR